MLVGNETADEKKYVIFENIIKFGDSSLESIAEQLAYHDVYINCIELQELMGKRMAYCTPLELELDHAVAAKFGIPTDIFGHPSYMDQYDIYGHIKNMAISFVHTGKEINQLPEQALFNEEFVYRYLEAQFSKNLVFDGVHDGNTIYKPYFNQDYVDFLEELAKDNELSTLAQKENELSGLKKEEQTISEAESLISKRNPKQVGE